MENKQLLAEIKEKGISISSTDTDIDVQKMKVLMKEGLEAIDTAKGNHVVLVIGSSGAGKSTTVHYLLGHAMVEKTVYGKQVIVPEDEKSSGPAIGHDAVSKTLHPTVYMNEGIAYAYGDCPGFADTRGLEEQAWISIATEMTVKKAKNINAVLVIIDYNTINTDRGRGFKDIMQTLSQLLNRPEEAAGSLHFAFTKVPVVRDGREYRMRTASEIHENIKALYETEVQKADSRLEKLKKKWDNLSLKSISFATSSNEKNELDTLSQETEDLNKKLKVLKIIVDNPKKITVIDPLDTGESREKLVSSIRQSQVISAEQFNFNKYDPARKKLDEFLFDKAHSTVKKIEKLKSIPLLITGYQKEISQAEDSIKFYVNNSEQDKKELAALKEGKKLPDDENKRKQRNQEYQKKIDENDKFIKSWISDIKEIEDEINNLTKQKAKIDKDELVECWKDSVYEERSFWGFGLGYTTKTFKYKGAPYAAVNEWYRHNDGKFTRIKESLEKGEYEAHYASNRGKDGHAVVTLYIAMRNTPDNKKQIESYNQSIGAKNRRRDELVKLKKKLEEENKECKQIIADNNDDREKTIEAFKKECEKRIHDADRKKGEAEAKIVILNTHIAHANTELEAARKFINEDKEILELISEIFSLVSYDSMLVKNFLIEYKSIIQNEDSSKQAQEFLTKNTFNDFVCPITQETMFMPAITVCGHTFEDRAIREYISQKANNKGECECPTCRVPIKAETLQINYALKSVIENLKNSIPVNVDKPESIEDLKKKVEEIDKTIEEHRYSIEKLQREKTHLVNLISSKTNTRGFFGEAGTTSIPLSTVNNETIQFSAPAPQ